MVAWIPANLAKPGHTLDDGWAIASAHTERDSSVNVRKAIKEHRKNTGDSERKRVPGTNPK